MLLSYSHAGVEPFHTSPRQLAQHAASKAERAALERLRVDCERCAAGAVPRDELVPFRVEQHGEIRAGFCCACRVRRITL